MTVICCNRCWSSISFHYELSPSGDIFISESNIPPELRSRSCPVCEQPYCYRCKDIEPLCPRCTGPRKEPGKEYWTEHIPYLCRYPDRASPRDVLENVWQFVRNLPSTQLRIREITTAFSESTLLRISSCAAEELARLPEKQDGLQLTYLRVESAVIPREFLSALVNELRRPTKDDPSASPQ